MRRTEAAVLGGAPRDEEAVLSRDFSIVKKAKSLLGPVLRATTARTILTGETGEHVSEYVRSQEQCLGDCYWQAFEATEIFLARI